MSDSPLHRFLFASLLLCASQVVAMSPAEAAAAADGAAPTAAPTAAPQAASPRSSAFGYDVFRAQAGDSVGAPISDEYLLSPGDEVVITIWGALNDKFELSVLDGGFLELPDGGGRVHISGLPFRDLRPQIVRALAGLYAAYINADDPSRSTAFVDVRLGKIRPMLVYVLGEVSQPGARAVSAGSANLLSLLTAAGGALESGSLREIRLRRASGETTVIDLYDLLLSGVIDSRLIQLHPGDYVTVPLKSKSVSITGAVKRPGSFELVRTEGLRRLLDVAGEFTPDAYLRHAQLRRQVVSQGEVFIDLNLEELLSRPESDYALQDGDSLQIGRSMQTRKGVVSISGDGVMRPGEYQWEPGITLSKLIERADGLREHAFLSRADLVRTEDDFSKRLKKLDLSGLYVRSVEGELEPTGSVEGDIILRDMDEVKVQSLWGLGGKDKSITLEGCVKEPGSVVLAEGMTLYDILFARGGFQDASFVKNAVMEQGHIMRRIPGMIGQEVIGFSLGEVLSGSESANRTLEDGDRVVIYSYEAIRPRHPVVIAGLVRAPDTYPVSSGMTVEDLVLMAGGLNPEVTQAEAVIARAIPAGVAGEARASGSNGQTSDASSLTVSLNRDFLQTPPGARTRLEPGDRVMVRHKPGHEPLAVVKVYGRVTLPGYYTIPLDGEPLSSVMRKAGGLSEGGFGEGISLRRLMKGPGGESRVEEVAINFEAAVRSPGGVDDVVVRNGDEIFIPSRPGVVVLRGALRQPHSLQYQPGRKLSAYVSDCGGFLDRADTKCVLLESANGSASSVDAASDPVVVEGCTVIVPFERETDRMRVVDVKGAVNKPATIQFIDEARLGYYLNLCGGLCANADLSQVVIHQPDGQLLVPQAGVQFNPTLTAGSIIIVGSRPTVEAK